MVFRRLIQGERGYCQCGNCGTTKDLMWHEGHSKLFPNVPLFITFRQNQSHTSNMSEIICKRCDERKKEFTKGTREYKKREKIEEKEAKKREKKEKREQEREQKEAEDDQYEREREQWERVRMEQAQREREQYEQAQREQEQYEQAQREREKAKKRRQKGTHYDVLGVPEGASQKAIKDAYRKLTLKWHPDKNKSHDAAKHFNKITEAYEILSNKDERKKYDAEL